MACDPGFIMHVSEKKTKSKIFLLIIATDIAHAVSWHFLFFSLSLFTLCQKHTSFTDTLDKCGSLIIILFSPNTLPSSFITHRLTQPSDIYTLPRYTVSSLNFYFSSHSPMFYTLIKASGELHISHIWCWNTGSTIKTAFFPQQCNY